MNTLKTSKYARNGYSITFLLFLFFSAIFCVSTRTNNLLHISIVLFLISLINKDYREEIATNIRSQWLAYTTLIIFFVYYGLSNVWGGTPQDINSTVTHGVYLLVYLLLLTTFLSTSETRKLTLICIISGITVISILSISLDYSQILTKRTVPSGYPGPTNVIDLAGYCGVGILICAMQLKEKGSRLLYIPIAIMLVTMLATQSRGPIIALLVSFLCTQSRHIFIRRNILIMIVLAILFVVFIFLTPMGHLLLSRFESIGTQSGLRISIWLHTFKEVSYHPWFGYGFDKDLDFTNYDGEHITTTHSVYLGTLLKGGIVGLLSLLVVIANVCYRAWKKRHEDGFYGLAIFGYTLIFIASQGMFVISNPCETWPTFWLPMAIALSSMKIKTINTNSGS